VSRVLLGELVAVGDEVLDAEAADDRAQVAVEDLADQVVHLRARRPARALVVQEARRGVGDRLLVVADLEDRHAAHADRDLLGVDALDVEDRARRAQAQVLGLLEDRQDERTAAGDDLERLDPRLLAAHPEAGDDQRLVGRRDLPEDLEQDEQQDRDQDDRGKDDDDGDAHGSSLRRVTSTVRGGS
jgi:hypothetical protein